MRSTSTEHFPVWACMLAAEGLCTSHPPGGSLRVTRRDAEAGASHHVGSGFGVFGPLAGSFGLAM